MAGTKTEAIADLDSDGDGFSNLTEFNAGTHPGDPANYPQDGNQADAGAAPTEVNTEAERGPVLETHTALETTKNAPRPEISAPYTEQCAVCHGRYGEGNVGPALAKPCPTARPALAIKRTIENGVPGTVMPGYQEQLSADEINGLVVHILSLPPTQTETPTQVDNKLAAWLAVAIGLLLGWVAFTSWRRQKEGLRQR